MTNTKHIVNTAGSQTDGNFKGSIKNPYQLKEYESCRADEWSGGYVEHLGYIPYPKMDIDLPSISSTFDPCLEIDYTKVIYPSRTQIKNDPFVKQKMNEAWEMTKAAANNQGRKEYGFYIYYDFLEKKFSVTEPFIEGTFIASDESEKRAEITFGHPNDNNKLCATFHTHTSLEYCKKETQRFVGPSDEDRDFANNKNNCCGEKIPGLVYDYSGTIIYNGWSKNKDGEIYEYGPKRRKRW